MSPPLDIKTLKVADLKEELARRGLPVSGLKAELVGRLQGAIDEEGRKDGEGKGEGDGEKVDEEGDGMKLYAPGEDKETAPVETSAPAQDAPPSTDQDQPKQPAPSSLSSSGPSAHAITQDDTDASIPTDAADKHEMIMGDAEGDLDERMERAGEEGRAERQAEEAKEDEVAEEARTGDKRRREEADGDVEMQDTSEKRPRSSPSPRPEASSSLPPNLRHVLHPPTRALYISNLRRPLQPADLREMLEEHGALDEAEEVGKGAWVDGVKSHCYATYTADSAALAAATAIEGTIFPPDHGQPLSAHFLPPSIVPDLITRERSAWSAGRQRLELHITPHTRGTNIPEGVHESEGVRFELGPPRTLAQVAQQQGRFIPGLASAVPLGIKPVLPPQRGPPPARGPMGIIRSQLGASANGAGGGANSVPLGPGAGAAAARQPPPHIDRQRVEPSRGYRKTVTRPVLFWREAPKYLKA